MKATMVGKLLQVKSFSYRFKSFKTQKMKKSITTAIIMLALVFSLNAQVQYVAKVETGYIQYAYRIVMVDPGPNWKGNYLNSDNNGFGINLMNGITFGAKKGFVGVGLGYLNFEGVSGVSVFGDFEYLPLKTKLTPLFNFKIGYNHIWNQYEGGTGTPLSEFAFGLNYRLTPNLDIYVKTGMLFMQHSFLVPAFVGVRFR